MYELYTWYAWGFGDHWKFRGEFNTVFEALNKINKRTTSYLIKRNGEIVDYFINIKGYRHGMVMPRMPK